MIHLDVLILLQCWLNLVYSHTYVDLSMSQHILRFSVILHRHVVLKKSVGTRPATSLGHQEERRVF